MLQIHIQFVENMLQVHQKYENLIAETFKNDPLFLSALDKACASVINSKLSDGKTTCRSAELVRFLITTTTTTIIIIIIFNHINFLGCQVLRQFAEEIKINRM
jgi:hypothetical protein